MEPDVVASTPDVIQKYLVDNSYGVLPHGPIGIVQIVPDQHLLVDAPQIFTRSVPDDVNYLIFLKQIRGRFMEMVADGEPWEHKGLNVHVRHPSGPPGLDGYDLTESLWRFLGKTSNQDVTLGSYVYTIQSIYRTQPIIDLGEEPEKSRSSWAFEVNVAFAYPPYQKIEG
jgi:hypothetical protein